MDTNAALAIKGGKPFVSRRMPPMYPGGMRIGPEEEQAVLDVIRSKRLFRIDISPDLDGTEVEEITDGIC
jgi:hypothetical protein